MKSKKLLSLLLVVLLLCATVSASFECIATNAERVDSFAEAIEELNAEEAEEEKTLEESAGSRVIVKAAKKPETYGNSECIKGTYGKFVFQYATEEEAEDAAAYYRTVTGVSYAVIDRMVQSQGVPYAEAMLGTQRAKEYIAANHIATTDMKVAVIDTGIDFSHTLFKDNARIVDSGLNTTDTGVTDSALDDNGHGSLCTELIMNNTAENVSVIGYKALNVNGSGTNLWIATAIEKAIEDDVDIINLSLGGESEPLGFESSIVMDDAVRLAISKGILVVAAAGNDGLNAEHFSPANVEGVITVGAIDSAGNRAYFSNYGDDVDFVAPGVEIEHEYFREYDQGNVHHIELKDPIDGTSFSCPFVVSEIAILLSVHRYLTRDGVVSELKRICVPYEGLTYHDGFHPIKEDMGVSKSHLYAHWLPWYEEPNPVSICYANGMPQIDLMFQSGNEKEVTPDFSIESGHFVDEELDLTLTASPEAEIYYTTDETFPTKENGIRYEGNIHLDELQSVRAIAFSAGKMPSLFSAREYYLEFHVPESDFVIDKYDKSRVNDYTGNRKNIIVPASINGKELKKVFVNKSSNAAITSAKLPENVISFGVFNGLQKNVVSIDGPGLQNVGYTSNGTTDDYEYYSLVQVNLPNAINVNLEGTNIRELNLPNAININCSDMHCLRKVTAKNFRVQKSTCTFMNCWSLQEVDMPELEEIYEQMFYNCYKLSKVSFENVRGIGYNGLADCRLIRQLYFPKLTTIYRTDSFVGCGVNFLYAPLLEKLPDFFGCYNDGYRSKIIVSSALKEFSVDAEGDLRPHPNVTIHYKYLVDIYGTPGTYAEEYAKRFDLPFVPLPLLESEPENMGYQSAGNITADVLGFNKECQWYGTNLKDNRLGIALEGETGETLNTSQYDYPYYYCVVKTHDGEYKKDIVTGTRKTLDMNGDGIIDIADISLLLSRYGSTPEKDFYDVSENGIVDIQDITYLLYSAVYGTTE